VRSPAPSSAPPAPFTRTYPATASQIRHIRADIEALLHDCPIADEVMICVSELATNSVIHSDSRRPGRVVTVAVEVRTRDHLRIEVSDDGGAWTRPGADPDRPHGLDIVQAFASTWGVTDTARGRTVWARLDWPAA
jgi:anti-sigma regulatory factor (Ser/Thr protein kinase)